MQSAFKTLRKRSSIETAAFVIREFFATLLPSTMPGTRLCTRKKTQLFIRPGLRFCGIADDTYVLSPPSFRMIQGRGCAYCTMMSLISEPA